MKMKFSHFAYGLMLNSTLALPELPVSEGVGEVTIQLGEICSFAQKTNNGEKNLRVTSEGIYLFYEGIGKFLVRKGYEIIVDPAPGVEESIVRLSILGPALGVLLHQRGRLVLHGSAVIMNGGAVAFLGEEGSGKSTLAAAMYVNGHSVVADDLVTLQIENGSSKVFPSAPRLKLSPEVAVSFGDFEKTQQISYPNLEIRSYLANKGFSALPLYLRQIYVLGESEDKKIEPLMPQEAWVELIRHSYCAKLISNGEAPSHLNQCATLVNQIPIFRLNRPRSISSLPDVVRMVEKDLAHG
jgi:energy-coupling factor transporter ATP-binding protein EcfA2